MCFRFFIAAAFASFLPTIAAASGEPAIPFVDGRWHGGIKTSPDNSDFRECWASTTFDDGTMLTLAKRKGGTWYLQLSNPGWQLPISRRYAFVALVDFYPRLRIAAEAKKQTLLEIENLDQISLLRLIENGHTIDLASDDFNEKYELEGSAKAIEKVRNCFAQQPDADSPETVNEPGK